MTYQYKFQKILDLKQLEKEQALSQYQDSLRSFEEAAEQLYTLLKKKEDLEEYQLRGLENGLSVDQIRHQQQFITNLDKTIEYSQRLVINARNTMNWHEEQLKECNIEMKKYEKIKEKSFQVYQHMMSRLENIQLDEFASQQFIYRGGS